MLKRLLATDAFAVHINHVAILHPLTIPNKFIFVFYKNIFLDSIGNVFTLHQNTQL